MADNKFNATLTQVPPCWTCKHAHPGPTCAAFPGGIPGPILDGSEQHREPYPGDNGIQYEPIERTRK
jgi:hypothetical protein